MKQHTFRRILRYLLPKWFLLIFVLLFSTASVLLNLYTTVLIGEGVDYIVGMGDVDFDAIARVAAIFAAAIGAFSSRNTRVPRSPTAWRFRSCEKSG